MEVLKKPPQERGPETHLKEEDEAVVPRGHVHPFPLCSLHMFPLCLDHLSKLPEFYHLAEPLGGLQAYVRAIPGFSETPALTSSLNKNPDQ